jgi:hypothetical protein
MRRSLIAVLLILWLPLQGFAAVAMPFCKHAMHGTQTTLSHAHPAQQAVAGHAHHGTMVATENGPTTENGSPSSAHHQSSAGLDCSDCGACHLACAPAVLPAQRDVLAVGGEHYNPASPSLPSLFNPERHQRPPLATVA